MEEIRPILEAAVQFIALILLALAPILAKWVAKYLDKRFDFAIRESDMLRILEAVDEGIQLAEEEALAAIKRNIDKPNGETKESRAIEYVLKTIEEENLQKRSSEWIAMKVRSRLIDLGAGASGLNSGE